MWSAQQKLMVDSRFKGAEDVDGCEAGTVFGRTKARGIWSPNEGRRLVTIFSRQDLRAKPSPDKKWSDDINLCQQIYRKKVLMRRKRGTPEAKNDLAKRPKKAKKFVILLAPHLLKAIILLLLCQWE
jgi:hypothetical protein